MKRTWSAWTTSPPRRTANVLEQFELKGHGKPKFLEPFQPPVLSCLLKFFKRCNHIADIFAHAGKVLRFCSFREIGPGKQGHQILDRNQPFLMLWFITIQVVQVFFRPEEMHIASGIRQVKRPFYKRNTCMPDHRFGFSRFYPTVFHTDFYGF